MQKKIELLFKIVVGLTFFVPLAFFPRSFIFPFIVPKVIIFRSLALILLGLYLILLSLDWKRYKIKGTPITVFVVLFLISFGASTFTGLDWYRSFWDNHERMLGFFSVTHYALYYFVITSVIRGWSEWKGLFRVFLLAGSIVMGIATIQQFDNEFLLNTSGNRSAATLGNAIYVGGYGLFLFASGWLLAVREKNNYWKGFAVLCAFLGFLGVFFSGSRGAFMGLGSCIGVFFISYIISLKKQKKVRYTLGAIVLGALLIVGTLFLNRDTAFVKSIPTVGRLLNTSINTVGTRLMAWDIAVESWKDYPVLGWGPGNYYFAFNEYYRAEFLRFGYKETWFDNAHNILLNTLTERGVVGFSVYIGIYLVVIISVWKIYKRTPDKVNPHFLAFATAFMIANLAQTVSVFDNPTSYIYFFFFLAFVNNTLVSIKSEGDNVEEGVIGARRISVPVILTVTLATSLAIYSTNINPARANMKTLEVLRIIYQYEDPRSAYESVINITTPHIDDIRNDVSRTISQSLRKYVGIGKAELARDLFSFAYEELDKNRNLHPLDLRVHAQQALLVQEAASLSGDKTLLLEAEKIMEDALSKSTERQQFIYTLAGIKIQLGKIDEGEELYKRAIEDYELIGESWWRLALLYSVTDRMDQAIETINTAREKGVTFGWEGDPVVADIFQRAGIEDTYNAE